MPPLVYREKPLVIAQNQARQQPVLPPLYEPINKERPYNDAKPADPPPQTTPEPEVKQPAPPPARVVVPETAPVQELPPSPPPVSSPVRVPNTVTLTAGTMLPVRIGETISAAHNQLGDTFLATLDQPLVIDGFIIAERGSRAEGRIVEVNPAGRGKGDSRLGIELVKLSTSDGQHIRIRTELYKKVETGSTTGSDLAKVGVGAAIGAAIGAAAGGGKGAAIGAGAGGVAGAAGAALSHGKPAEIRVETRISFRVQEPVTITERLN